MCSVIQVNDITARVAESYRKAFGNDIIKIVLYGSYARGDNDDQSDIDYAAIVEGNRLELQEKLKDVWNETAIIGLDNDVVVSPIVIPNDEYEKYKVVLPYYRNIEQEGKVVG